MHVYKWPLIYIYFARVGVTELVELLVIVGVNVLDDIVLFLLSSFLDFGVHCLFAIMFIKLDYIIIQLGSATLTLDTLI